MRNSISKAIMRHVSCRGFGGVDVLAIQESPLPTLKKGEVLMKVKATALNRADILQREGKYPPPKGVTEVLGLEASGTVVDSNMNDTGRRVFSLLSGGGYAEYVAVQEDHLIDIPKDMSFQDAAGVAETWMTAFQLLRRIGNVQQGENVMIYAGASGVGTSAIQLCSKIFNANPFVSVSSKEKLDFCKNLGAINGIIYKDNEQQKEEVMNITNKKGIDIILDCIGGSNAALSSGILREDARWVLYGMMGGPKVPGFNLAALVSKRASLLTSTLRNRSDTYKAELVKDFKREVMPAFKSKQLGPVIHSKYDIDFATNNVSKVQEAHKEMEANKNSGKIILNFI